MAASIGVAGDDAVMRRLREGAGNRRHYVRSRSSAVAEQRTGMVSMVCAPSNGAGTKYNGSECDASDINTFVIHL